MPMLPRKTSQIKKKYHKKTLSQSAIYVNWLRNLDVAPMFAEYIWLLVSAFDLTQLGLGLLYDIAPADFEPFNIDFSFVQPSIDELMQGIWVKFEPKDYGKLYTWMLDLDSYTYENIKEEYQESIVESRLKEGIYGVTSYGKSVYDPFLVREFMRATVYKMRLLRTPDISWKQFLEQIKQILEMADVTDKHLYNRLMLMFSVQKFAFVLGLSILGYSFLTETEGDYGKVPFIDADGNIYEVKFRTLDHLQMGLILGVTPLGHGLLMPKNSLYKMEDEKKNPPVVNLVVQKILGMKSRVSLTSWAYANYNKPEEMTKPHESERMEQYDMIQWQRRKIEEWVERQIPAEEANPVKIRQYKNAVLQIYGWKAKRHKWGFNAWRFTTDEEFKQWWLNHWTAQGLNRQTLERLYEGVKRWLPTLRSRKLELGEKVRRRRLSRALSL